MYREKRRNKIIILILVGIICLMGAGYAAFKTSLEIKGIGNINGEWNIKITNVEVAEESGNGANKNFSFEDTKATLEADLYNKGDYVTYNITVTNNGSFDAKLASLGLTKSTNEAVLITSNGLVSGQTLYKEESITFSVKIEYNSNYVGDASGTTGMADLTLDFVQNSGGTVVPTEDYLVHYDYTTNGGVSTNAEDEYVTTGTAVNLNYTAVKENAEFIGWNTNSGANEGLESLTMPNSEITLYAIFKDKDNTPPVISNVSTSSTINSITVVTTATEEDGEINHYEYSIDNGSNWIKVSGTNNYTFTGLTSNTNYKILVRVYNESEKYSEEEVNVSTKKLNAPTFSEKESDNGKIVIISYPEGEGLVYEYQKDSGSWTTATQNQEVEFTESGTLVARVSDGTNEESSSYSVEIKPSIGGTEVDIVTSGDGLYVDSTVEGRYVYKGTNPNNYISFNNELWRIIAVEPDGTIKIMSTNTYGPYPYDDKSTSRSTSNTTYYCYYSGTYWGCNVFGSSSNMYDTNKSQITAMTKSYAGTTTYNLPSRDATSNIYLNETFYNSIDSAYKGIIDTHYFANGFVEWEYSDTEQTLQEDMQQESKYFWRGKIGLPSALDYVKSSSNVNCDSLYSGTRYEDACRVENYMYEMNSANSWWTMTLVDTSDRAINAWAVVGGSSRGDLMDLGVYNEYYLIPTLYLSTNIEIVGGKGTSISPYQIG